MNCPVTLTVKAVLVGVALPKGPAVRVLPVLLFLMLKLSEGDAQTIQWGQLCGSRDGDYTLGVSDGERRFLEVGVRALVCGAVGNKILCAVMLGRGV
ncbi:hypothetical protein C8F01DRAFT_1135438, partial [Mycena amicta]